MTSILHRNPNEIHRAILKPMMTRTKDRLTRPIPEQIRDALLEIDGSYAEFRHRVRVKFGRVVLKEVRCVACWHCGAEFCNLADLIHVGWTVTQLHGYRLDDDDIWRATRYAEKKRRYQRRQLSDPTLPLAERKWLRVRAQAMGYAHGDENRLEGAEKALYSPDLPLTIECPRCHKMNLVIAPET